MGNLSIVRGTYIKVFDYLTIITNTFDDEKSRANKKCVPPIRDPSFRRLRHLVPDPDTKLMGFLHIKELATGQTNLPSAPDT